MSKISSKHIEFINLVVKGVSQQEAYILTSTNKHLTKPTARVEGSKLAKRYAKEIQERKEIDASIVTDAANKYEAISALKSVVEQAKADAKVFRILGDDDNVEDVIIVAGKVQTIERKPTQGEIQKAYDLYCKRFGSNAPTKTALTNTNGEDVKQVIIINGKEIEF